MGFPGISTKKMKNGSNAIMVRFKHNGITYPVKNFTKLFGSKTESEANEKLREIKVSLSKGKDPFSSSPTVLNELWKERLKLNEKNNVWAKSTIKNNKYFFKKYISESIGKYKIEKIKYEHIKKILDNFRKEQTSIKNRVIDLLKPIFEEEKRKGNIDTNIFDNIKKVREIIQREHLSKRTNFNYEDIVRKLYNAIPLYNQAHVSNIKQHQTFLYMLLLTAHRYNEINHLEKKHCDIVNKKIIAPASITKTKEDYHFPIPDECIEYIKNAPEGRLFNVPRGGTASRIFHRLLIKANITTIENHSISMHDTRRLMLSIMIGELNIDSRLADLCLDHKPQGTIKHYLQFTYEDKVKAYTKYWDYVRSIDNSDNEKKTIINNVSTSNNGSNFDKLKELIDMHNKGYLTQEQFEYERDNLYK